MLHAIVCNAYSKLFLGLMSFWISDWMVWFGLNEEYVQLPNTFTISTHIDSILMDISIHMCTLTTIPTYNVYIYIVIQIVENELYNSMDERDCESIQNNNNWKKNITQKLMAWNWCFISLYLCKTKQVLCYVLHTRLGLRFYFSLLIFDSDWIECEFRKMWYLSEHEFTLDWCRLTWNTSTPVYWSLVSCDLSLFIRLLAYFCVCVCLNSRFSLGFLLHFN